MDWSAATAVSPIGFDDAELLKNLCKSVRDMVRESLLAVLPGFPTLAGLDTAELLAGMYFVRYGSVYWCNTEEASLYNEQKPDRKKMQVLTDWLEAGASEICWTSAVINWLVTNQTAGTLELVDGRVPSFGFQTIAPGQYVLNARDAQQIAGRLPTDQARPFDLHDFAHVAATMVDAERYGCVVHTPAFRGLATDLRDLVAGYENNRKAPEADGTIFSRVLTMYFEENVARTDEELVGGMADTVCEYLDARRSVHVGSEVLGLDQRLSVAALAVLVQNKFYEWPASEIEMHLLRRGGQPQQHDVLHGMSWRRRVVHVMSTSDRTHFERRNVLKHRAQLIGYLRFAQRLADSKSSADQAGGLEILRLAEALLYDAILPRFGLLDLASEMVGA